MLFVPFPIFVFSGGRLFLSLLVSLSPSCSRRRSGGIYGPDRCELTYTNALLLPNASLSLGCAFICEEAAVGAGNFSIISFILACAFLSLQIKEFHTLGFYINDSILGSIFFSLTGLHFFHVVVGIIPACQILRIVPFVKWLSFICHLVFLFHLYHNLQLIYWHFVELLWFFNHLILYT